MKRQLSIIFTGIFLTFFFCSYGQVPQSINYQAVVRDNDFIPVTDQLVSLRISILRESPGGDPVYIESHQVNSNSFGLINLKIGEGETVSGTFTAIDWSADEFFLKIELDPEGGNNFLPIGISQLISVPYALHAQTAEFVDDADADPANEIQTLSFNINNNELSISGGNTITIPSGGTDADPDPTNEIQTLSKTGNSITLSLNGGTVTDEVDDADPDPSNEIQTLSKTGNSISLSQNGGSVTDEVDDADPDPVNEIQTLSKAGNTITLSQNGGSVMDEVDDADADPDNEIQTLSKTGNSITLSQNGGTVTDEVIDADADPTNEIQTLGLNGNILSITNGNSVSLNATTPWISFANGIYYDQGEAWVGNAGMAPGLKMTQSGMSVLGTSNTSSLTTTALLLEEGGAMRARLSTGLMEFWDGTGQYTTAIGGFPGFMGTYYGGNPVSAIGLNAGNSGAIGLYNPSGNLNVNITSVVGQPDAGLIDVNFNGAVRARMSANSEDAGYFYSYGPSNIYNTYHGYVAGYPNIGAFYAAQNGNLRSKVTSNLEDAGEIITFGPSSENVKISNPPGLPQTGKIALYHLNKLTSVLSIDAQNDAGAMATYNPSDDLNVMLSTYAPASPDQGAVRVFGDGVEKVALLAKDDGTGAVEVRGPASETIVNIGADSTDPESGKIEVLNDYDAKVTLSVTNEGAGALTSKGLAGNKTVEITPPLGQPNAGGLGIYSPMGNVNIQMGVTFNDPEAGTIGTFKDGFLVNLLDLNPGNAGTFSTYGPYGSLKTLTSTSTFNEAGTFQTYHNNMALTDLTTSNANGGYILTYLNQLPMTHLTHNGAGAGGLWLANSNNFYDVTLTTNNDPSNTGGILQLFKNGNEKLKLTTSTNVGIIQAKGAAGQLITDISSPNGDDNSGCITLYHMGSIRTMACSNQDNGVIKTYDDIWLENVNINALASNTSHGYISVNDFNGIPQAGAYVDAGGQGIVFGDVKSFRMPHPEKAGKEIWYASVEGPEAAAYVRGTGTLIGGKVTVQFPDHFRLVANPETMTVMMTPLSPESKGLCVTGKTENGFTVQELWKGKGNYDFDWEVKCVRKGYEDFRVIRDMDEAAPAPTPLPKKMDTADGGLPQPAATRESHRPVKMN
ncbi:MAG: hypothetical protein KDC85_15350 [Saprospiraceae bacterium]|nr:hypothetical protein [Saprospiraceae bacterium]MCB9325121.1 hypothetical protein [Lewinellaceae bacterium]